MIPRELAGEIGNLPPLPESVVAIKRICSDPDSAIHDLVRVVERDPLMTANLLRQANTPFYGHAGRVSRIAQAVSLFGMTTILGFALSSAVRDTIASLDLSPYDQTPDQLAAAARLRSALIFQWLNSPQQRLNRETLVNAAFLDGIGRAVIATVVVRRGEGARFREAISSGEAVDRIEQRHCNATAQQVGADILRHWHLDPLMSAAIAASDSPFECEPSIRLHAAVLAVAREQVEDRATLLTEPSAESIELIELINQPLDPLCQALERVAASAEQEQAIPA